MGAKVTILKGVTIGDKVVIGAHVLVNKDVKKNYCWCTSKNYTDVRVKETSIYDFLGI